MKRNRLFIIAVSAGLLLNGCSNKELKVEEEKTLKSTKTSQKNSDIEVEIMPASDKKVEVITKVKPKVSVLTTEKLEEGEVPVVVVEPVNADVPVEEVNILPVVDNTVGIVTKVKPTIEVVEELPIEDDVPSVVIEPIIE
jgi:PBP1b-binding outer membrane lipoprotein LpoB